MCKYLFFSVHDSVYIASQAANCRGRFGPGVHYQLTGISDGCTGTGYMVITLIANGFLIDDQLTEKTSEEQLDNLLLMNSSSYMKLLTTRSADYLV